MSFQTEDDFDSANVSFEEGVEFAKSSGYSHDELLKLIPVQDAGDQWFVGFRDKEWFDSLIDHDFDSKKDAMAFIKGATSGLNESKEYLCEGKSQYFAIKDNEIDKLVDLAYEIGIAVQRGSVEFAFGDGNKLDKLKKNIRNRPIEF